MADSYGGAKPKKWSSSPAHNDVLSPVRAAAENAGSTSQHRDRRLAKGEDEDDKFRMNGYANKSQESRNENKYNCSNFDKCIQQPYTTFVENDVGSVKQDYDEDKRIETKRRLSKKTIHKDRNQNNTVKVCSTCNLHSPIETCPRVSIAPRTIQGEPVELIEEANNSKIYPHEQVVKNSQQSRFYKLGQCKSSELKTCENYSESDKSGNNSARKLNSHIAKCKAVVKEHDLSAMDRWKKSGIALRKYIAEKLGIKQSNSKGDLSLNDEMNGQVRENTSPINHFEKRTRQDIINFAEPNINSESGHKPSIVSKDSETKNEKKSGSHSKSFLKSLRLKKDKVKTSHKNKQSKNLKTSESFEMSSPSSPMKETSSPTDSSPASDWPTHFDSTNHQEDYDSVWPDKSCIRFCDWSFSTCDKKSEIPENSKMKHKKTFRSKSETANKPEEKKKEGRYQKRKTLVGLLDREMETSSDEDSDVFVFDPSYGEVVRRRRHQTGSTSRSMESPTRRVPDDSEQPVLVSDATAEALSGLKYALPYLPERLRRRATSVGEGNQLNYEPRVPAPVSDTYLSGGLTAPARNTDSHMAGLGLTNVSNNNSSAFTDSSKGNTRNAQPQVDDLAETSAVKRNVINKKYRKSVNSRHTNNGLLENIENKTEKFTNSRHANNAASENLENRIENFSNFRRANNFQSENLDIRNEIFDDVFGVSDTDIVGKAGDKSKQSSKLYQNRGEQHTSRKKTHERKKDKGQTVWTGRGSMENLFEDPFHVSEERNESLCSGLLDLIDGIDIPFMDDLSDESFRNIDNSSSYLNKGANSSNNSGKGKSSYPPCLQDSLSLTQVNGLFSDQFSDDENDFLFASGDYAEIQNEGSDTGQENSLVRSLVSNIDGNFSDVQDGGDLPWMLSEDRGKTPDSESLSSPTDGFHRSRSRSESESSQEADDEFECDCEHCLLLRQHGNPDVLELGGENEVARQQREDEMRYGVENDLISPLLLLRIPESIPEDGELGISISELTSLDFMLMAESSLRLDIMLENVIQQMLAVQPELLNEQAAPPAPTAVIEGLPTLNLNLEHLEQSPSCPICLCPSEIGDVMSRLPCQHIFHPICVQAWLVKSGTCPVCRGSV